MLVTFASLCANSQAQTILNEDFESYQQQSATFHQDGPTKVAVFKQLVTITHGKWNAIRARFHQ